MRISMQKLRFLIVLDIMGDFLRFVVLDVMGDFFLWFSSPS